MLEWNEMNTWSNGGSGTDQFEPLQWNPAEINWTSLCDVDEASLQHGHRTEHVDPPARRTHTQKIRYIIRTYSI